MIFLKDGFFRIACATPSVRVADCQYNMERIAELIREAAEQGAGAVVFPELCITGYTCGDLFLTLPLLRGAERALAELARRTEDLDIVAVVGLPVAAGSRLYNCAAVLYRGEILGLTAKKNIPNYSEFYEARYFTPCPDYLELDLCGAAQTLAGRLLLRCESLPGLTFGIEICEDLWVADPPSVKLAEMGATVLLNLSASDETIGKAAYRRSLVSGQSARLFCAYAYADAGQGESSTDMVFSGHNIIAENGAILAQSKAFSTGLITADIDVQRLCQERLRTTTWHSIPTPEDALVVSFDLPERELDLRRKIEPMPFVPADTADLEERCEAILMMQAQGLRTRLAHTHCRSAVVGLSGGLDSTLALLVTVRAFDLLGLDRKGVLAVSMPCFGTTSRTKNNAEGLAHALGVSFREIPIRDAVTQHFADIGQDPAVHDVTYENAQARERTQVLMDLANQTGGMVIGTGDLSELALGWATYNGDHMSMYGVNASIPKTLVRHLVHYAALKGDEGLRALLLDILDTPVSPELLPPVDGVISQKTEDLVGPYELHDFFLYYMLRYGFGPAKIYRMAKLAFDGRYTDDVIKKWLVSFCRRFFAQQFKRSCLPDGPKVGSVTLSPRGDFRMPSDACAVLWMEEANAL